MAPDLATSQQAWAAASARAAADPRDEFALDAAEAAANRLSIAAGHGRCAGFAYDTGTPLTCSCGTPLETTGRAAA